MFYLGTHYENENCCMHGTIEGPDKYNATVSSILIRNVRAKQLVCKIDFVMQNLLYNIMLCIIINTYVITTEKVLV